MTDSIYCVYKHTSPSGKSYIGITKNYEDRCYRHQLQSSKCIAFKYAITKYGWEAFTHEILNESITLDEANKLEHLYITSHNTLSPNGYNLNTGGNVRVMSEESKQKMRETIKKNPRPVRVQSPEELLLKSQRMTGRKASAETRAKLSAMRRGKQLSDEHKESIRVSRIGKTHSPETILKLKIKRPNYTQLKPLIQYTLDGIIVNEFINPKSAIAATGIKIANCLTGITKTAGGFIWKYKES